MTIEARLKADSHSLPANTQMLITAALVTESLQPVRHPIKIQKTVCMTKAFPRLTFNTFMINGRQARNPVKCMPDTARK
jgi:hypothetical protein